MTWCPEGDLRAEWPTPEERSPRCLRLFAGPARDVRPSSRARNGHTTGHSGNAACTDLLGTENEAQLIHTVSKSNTVPAGGGLMYSSQNTHGPVSPLVSTGVVMGSAPGI